MTRKRSRLISLLLALIVTGVGFLIWELTRARYTARARLLVAAAVPKVLFQTVETEGRSDDYRRYQLTQVALVKSQFVLNAALHASDGKVNAYRTIQEQADPIAWLQDNLKVDFVSGSEVMEIALSGDRPSDIAGIVNAVKNAYMEEVANKDANQRSDRHTKLKKIKDNYAVILKERQDTIRKLSESVGSDGLIAGVRKDVLSRLYYDLGSQRVQLKLERAEAETLLGRRRKTAGDATGSARKEIEQIEDRLAILGAREAVLAEELKQTANVMSAVNVFNSIDLTSVQDEISQMRDAAQKVGAEIEKLNIELEAPSRIRPIEDAGPPTRRSFLTERILATIFHPSTR
jgi:uncharacterized protein involved in exopolysaccharide biosynthesis